MMWIVLLLKNYSEGRALYYTTIHEVCKIQVTLA